MNKSYKKLFKTLGSKEREFVNLMTNYTLALVLGKKEREIKEFSDLIKIQNERSGYK